MLLTAATVIAQDQPLQPGWIQTDRGRVTAVGAGTPPRTVNPDLGDLDLGERIVVPGFVDMHGHGGGGGAFPAGDAEQARAAVELHGRHGTTTGIASLVTASPDDLLRIVSVMADLTEQGVIAGTHLEGPWLSDGRPGAHEQPQLRDPDPAELDRVFAAGRGTIRMVTLAPERAGGLDAVRRVVGAGAAAAVGHTDASYDQALAAIEAGATIGTHLFNAMRPVHPREPGPVIALLEDPRVTVELITDGVHLHPALYRDVAHVAGPDRVALVTDAMAAAGMADGAYRLGALDVTVANGVARLTGSDIIAGSTATMDHIFRYAVRHSGLPLLDGVLAAVRQTSANPAAALGLAEVGRLAPGYWADLVVLDADLAHPRNRIGHSRSQLSMGRSGSRAAPLWASTRHRVSLPGRPNWPPAIRPSPSRWLTARICRSIGKSSTWFCSTASCATCRVRIRCWPNPSVVRAGGALTVFEGDYATITLATGADGPFNSCVSAFRSSYINDPWLVRRLPALVRAAGFRPGPLRSHGVIQTDDPNYLLSVADRGADALARSGRIGGELAEALRAEARRRVRTHEFFGYIGYASLIAVKAH